MHSRDAETRVGLEDIYLGSRTPRAIRAKGKTWGVWSTCWLSRMDLLWRTFDSVSLLRHL